jgi:YesN/AraC family two-component response regulator
VTVAGTVPDALSLITSQEFDVLISDLNMGHAADGFTVVHAMRRSHPKCINFILTGFPAFESALQALRSQVDDYFTKPSNIPMLVASIERHLNRHVEREEHPAKRLADLLRSKIEEIKARTLVAMREHPQLGGLPLPMRNSLKILAP